MTEETYLSQILYPMPTEHLRRELEAYRVDWERANNRKVDLSRSYVSMWPAEYRDWLQQNDTKRYFDNIPEFVQDYMRAKMKMAADSGRLDDMGSAYVQLYLNGGMNKGGPSRGR